MPKKAKTVAAAPEATDPTAASPEELAKTLGQVSPEDTVAALLEKVTELATRNDRLEAENRRLGTQAPRDGGRSIVSGENVDEIELPREIEPRDPGDFAVFRSPHKSFMQKLEPGETIFHGNDYRLLPPSFATFIRGTCILYDKDQIAAMRAVEIENKRRNRPVFMEVLDDKERARMEKTATLPEAPSNAESISSLEEAISG